VRYYLLANCSNENSGLSTPAPNLTYVSEIREIKAQNLNPDKLLVRYQEVQEKYAGLESESLIKYKKNISDTNQVSGISFFSSQ
jgi:hypothetical protein